jgi:hypothetical protein
LKPLYRQSLQHLTFSNRLFLQVSLSRKYKNTITLRLIRINIAVSEAPLWKGGAFHQAWTHVQVGWTDREYDQDSPVDVHWVHINLDGGGSCVMAISDQGEPTLLSIPYRDEKTPGVQRPVGNFLGVIADSKPLSLPRPC